MSDNNRNRGINGRGYYIALILCAAAVGITGYLYYRNTSEAPEPALQETRAEYVPAGTENVQDVEVIATEATAAPTRPAETTRPTETRALQTQSPIAGEEIFGYSMEALSYNETTRDWRVHNGVDIAAEEGTEVCAAAEGTVTAVYEDDALGYTVELRHIGGYTTCYASLRELPQLKAGDTVAMGQVIGYAGCSALVETVMGSHVHFSVTCQGEPMDPAEFLEP